MEIINDGTVVIWENKPWRSEKEKNIVSGENENKIKKV